MSVITISRGSFSGGKLLAECLSGKTGYRCVDRDVIVERAAAYGVSQDELREALQKPPSFLERFKHTRYRYLTLIQSALADEVCTGKVIYHGHAGHLLLEGGAPVLRVRIIAPLEMRTEMAQERLKISRNEVISYIEKMDEERRKWTHFLYGVDWQDPSLYDIVINLEHIDIQRACQIVADVIKGQQCFEYSEQCRATMRDLAIAYRVKANLVINPDTSDLEVNVECHDGAVKIRGKVSSLDQVKEAERIALGVPGVTSVDLSHLASSTPG